MNTEKERLIDATNNLVTQQFYKEGQDIIIGRTPEIKVKISNSGQIIKKFKDLFNENLKYFLEGNYKKFLLPFKKIKGINEENIRQIHEELQHKLKNFKDENSETGNIILYTLVLSSLISRIRDIHFNDSIEEIKKRISKKHALKSSGVRKEQVQLALDNLFMRNNENISILYNISYLNALAESFNYKKVAHICKIQKSKFINRIVQLVQDSV
ncbi:MAG: hypothetical protein EU532_00720 [Promethearchaeota archaeon]|nr:MAG: hypothetical protein EU532_00720 [Candidatus Lokiarchaeota archaeon]